MQILYKDGASPGNGFIVFSQAVIPEGPWSVSIQRSSDQKFLTGKDRGQWVGEHVYFNAPGKPQQDGSLEVAIDSAVVDSLDQREQYRVEIKGASGEAQRGRLKIGQITYTPGGSLDNMASGEKGSTGVKADEPPSRPEPEPQQKPVIQEAPAEPLPDLETVASNRKKPILPIILILLLIGAGIAAYFLFRDNHDNSIPQTAKQEARESAPIRKQVDAFFENGGGEPAQALALARKFTPETPEDFDAVYRLYNYAGERGEDGALLAYGAFFDPALPQRGTIQKDALVAWEIYGRARKSNEAEALKAMENLRAWLEAQEGNPQAQAWLSQIRD